MVVVHGDDALDVFIELLALHGSGEDVIVPLLRGHGRLDLFRQNPVGALDHDPVDRDLASLRNLERHRHVAIGQLLGLGCHRDLEVALLLVRLLELLGGAVHLDGIVDTAQLQVDLLGQCGGVELLVAAEDDVAHERPLDHDEGDLHAALEVLDLELHVVEEAERKDGANVLSEAGGLKRRAGLGTDAAQDDRFLHPPIPLHHDVFDDRRGSRRRRGWWHWRLRRRHARRQWQKGKKNGEKRSPGAHEMG